jgi:hypothetical protein
MLDRPERQRTWRTSESVRRGVLSEW